MLKNKRGAAFQLSVALMLTMCMLLVALMSFLSAVTLIYHQRDNTEKVLDSYTVRNAITIYHSVKLGDGDRAELDADAFLRDLSEFCLLDNRENQLYSYDSEGALRYRLTAPTLTAQTAPDGVSLRVTARYTLYIPLYFAGAQAAAVSLPVELTVHYTPKP